MPKRYLLVLGLVLVVAIYALWPASNPQAVAGNQPVGTKAGDYVVIGWNTLGMHCITPSFKDVVVLPPFNTLCVQVVLRGDPPVLVTSGVSLDYSVDRNTTFKGKTDFWDYGSKFFGKLKAGQGLTGNYLSGTMKLVGDHYEASGIPVTPYNDRMDWYPYQKAIVKLHGANGGIIRTTEVILPVSDELHCEKCHADNSDGNPTFATGSPFTNILKTHDRINGTNLYGSRPVFCGSCHSDNALGAKGDPNIRSLSRDMHVWHANVPSDKPGCYDCHPGPNTQCLRNATVGMGVGHDNPNCATCHGDLDAFAAALDKGRKPWIEEPTCEQCHGPIHSTGDKLYRDSTGHGGLNCCFCHNSPHAWWPSRLVADNAQPMTYQNQPMSIGLSCSTCHTRPKDGHNPHAVFDSSPLPIKTPKSYRP
jgi:hypothetical protein